MWQRSVHAELRKTSGAEEQFRDQAEVKGANYAGEIPAADIEATPGDLKPIAGNVPVGTEQAAGALPEIGNYHNVGLVISCAGFNPCLPLAHVVGCSEVCVPVTAPDFQATELVDQKEVDHAGDRVGAVHSRGAI